MTTAAQMTSAQTVKYPDIAVVKAECYAVGMAVNWSNFSIKVKNIGTRTITAINWEWHIYDSIRDNYQIDHLKFRTDDKKVKPGETKKFSKDVRDNDYGGFPDNIKAEVSITRIEFSDGSIWELKR